MDGLGEILKQKYDPDYKSGNKIEIEKKLTEISISRARKLKEKKSGRKLKNSWDTLHAKATEVLNRLAPVKVFAHT